MPTDLAPTVYAALCLVLAGCSLQQRAPRSQTPRAGREGMVAPGADAAGERVAQPSVAAPGAKQRSAREQRSGRRSNGCGLPAGGTGRFESEVLEVFGRERTYHLLVPAQYDSQRAYPLVFRFHGSGGDGLSGGLAIERQTDDGAIVVGPDGVHHGWSEAHQGADLALFDSLLTRLAETYCVDLDRVFAYGFSMGAHMSELLACKRGHALRAIAAIAGWSAESSEASCNGKVAAWLAHDRDDAAVPLAKGRRARDRLLQQNGCSEEFRDAGDGCVRYQGCAEGQPVVWCETSGWGHDIRGAEAPAEVWRFFSSLPAR